MKKGTGDSRDSRKPTHEELRGRIEELERALEEVSEGHPPSSRADAGIGQVLKGLEGLIEKAVRFHAEKILTRGTVDEDLSFLKPFGADVEEQKFYREFIQSSNDGMYFIDLMGNFRFVNRTAERLVGYSKEEMIGRNIAHFLYPDGLKKALDLMTRVLAGKSVPPHELVVKAASGDRIGEMNVTLVKRSGLPIGFLGVARDVTDRKEVERALRRSEARLQAVIESVPFDLFALDKEGRYTIQNSACREHWGDVIGRKPADVASTEEVRRLWEENNRRAMSGETVEGEVCFDRDGERKTFFNVISPIRSAEGTEGVLGVNIDVTRWKDLEEGLRESGDKYHLLTEHNPEAVFLGDDEGAVLEANPAACRIFGYTVEEFRRLRRKDLHAPGDPAFQRAMEDRRRKGRFEGEVLLRRKDGSTFPGKLTVNTFQDRHGRQGLIGIVNDISERKEMESLLAVQHNLADGLASATSLMAGLELCMQAACRASAMEAGGIYLLDREKGALELKYERNLSPRFAEKVKSFPLDCPHGRIVLQGKPQFSTVAERNDIVRDDLEPEGLKALAVLPIMHDGRVVGCMNITSKEVVEVSPSARVALEAISAQIGSAIVRLTQGAALRKSEEKYRQLVSNIPVVTWTSDSGGKTTFVSPNVEKIYGYTPEEICASGADIWLGRVHPEERGKVKEAYRALFEQGREFDVEYRIRHRDGRWVWLRDRAISTYKKGGVRYAFGVFGDITQRKEAEQALRESEDRYRALVKSLPLGIQEIDVEGTITYANPSHHRMYGYGERELIGRPVFDLSPTEEEGEELREFLKHLVEEEPLPTPWVGKDVRKDGSFIEVQVDWDYKRDSEGRVVGFTSIMSDVTERRRAVQALRESEEKFRILAEESPNMIFINRAGKVVYANRQCELQTGYGREELLSEDFDFRDLVAPEDRQKAQRSFVMNRRGTDVPPREYGLITKDGRRVEAIIATRLVSYRGEKVVLGIVTDITVRKKAEKALRESEERYRGLVEKSKEIIFTLNRAGEFTFLNPAFTDVTGWSPEAWLGKKFEAIVPREELTLLRPRFAAVLQGKVQPQGEVRVTTKAGGLITVEYTTVPLVVDGAVNGIWGIARDVTARRKNEEDRKNIATLREREGVSRWLHDHIGADLYNILLLVDGIQRGSAEPAVVSEQLEWITETSRRSLAGIRNYLDFASQVGSTFKSMVESMEKYGRGIFSPLRVEFRFQRQGDLSACSPTGVQSFSIYLIYKEALTNIVKHAWADRVSVLIAVRAGRLEIVIEDDGKGFPVEGTLSGHYGTTNIRARAEELGADLRITTEPKQGTKVVFSMPLGIAGGASDGTA